MASKGRFDPCGRGGTERGLEIFDEVFQKPVRQRVNLSVDLSGPLRTGRVVRKQIILPARDCYSVLGASTKCLLSAVGLLFAVFFVGVRQSSAALQEVDGPANFRESPNGRIMAVLDNGVTVCVAGQIGQWFEVVLALVKEDGQIAAKIPAGSTLISNEREKLGKVVSPFISYQELPEKLFAVRGFLYHTNLRVPQTVESALLELVQFRKGTISQPPFDMVQSHISQFQYKKWREPFGTYVLYDATTCDPYQLNPLPSVVLITSQDQLIGFIHHRNDKSFADMPGSRISDMWNLVILGSPSREERRKLVDQFSGFLRGAN